ncbi:MAG: arsenic efflux protein [Oscillospiraceae bacterium]|nr:arsenic efflux protein [Oscillospiraceae bacterium]
MDFTSIFNTVNRFAAAHEHSHGEFDILDILLDSVIDTAKMLPFLFIAFMVMEYIEHKAGDKLVGLLRKTGGGRFAGSVAGALIGCIPQCGFSVAAANFYSGRLITMGTLAAVFISTSDEAIPVLLAHPDKIGMIFPLIAAKVVIAVIAGIIIDGVRHMLKSFHEEEPDFEDFCSDCGCGSHGIWYSAMKHTVKIAVFILIVNVVLGIAMGLAGEDKIAEILSKTGVFQPFLTALVGLIPNCAASVLVTELYADGMITFGSAVAGLSAGAGVGLAVLFRTNKHMKENLIILCIVYFTGVLSGTLINLF